jgi:hypothetical protein
MALKKISFLRRSSLVLLAWVLVGLAWYIAQRPRFDKQFDMTASGLNTLSSQSLKTLTALSDSRIKLEIIASFQDELKKHNFSDLINLYIHQGLSAAVTYIDPQQEPKRTLELGISESNLVIIRSGDKEARITKFGEYDLLDAFQTLLQDGTAKICFTAGHGEREISKFLSDESDLGVILQKKYEMVQVDASMIKDASPSCSLVVVAGALKDFLEEEIQDLKAFLNSGGSILIMSDALTKVDQLNKVSEPFGLSFNNDLITFDPKDSRAKLYGPGAVTVSDLNEFHPISLALGENRSVALVFTTARSITVKDQDVTYDWSVDVIGRTDANVVALANVSSLAELQQSSPRQVKPGPFPVFAIGTKTVVRSDSSSVGKSVATAPTAVRVALIGSSALLTEFSREWPENKTILAALFDFLTSKSHASSALAVGLATKRSSSIQPLTETGSNWLNFVCYMYPFAFLLAALFCFFQRRNI